jgi:glucosamine--fructose-6-phosphate aminotransferase (isomerizing)
MDKNTTATYHEITTQTDAWEEAISVVAPLESRIHSLMQEGYRQVIFSGCGSTYYLSLSAAALFQKMTGFNSRAVPGGELLFNPEIAMTKEKTLLVAVSRSGSTSETVKAVENFKKGNHGKIVAITNYSDQPLAGLADLAIVLPKGQESSVAQTRSFASMFVAATAFSALAAGKTDALKAMQKLPTIGSRLMSEYAEFSERIGADLGIDRFYFLGSGIRYGLACETNLKMKEMTLTHSEPFHFMEFRHGPMSMVTPSTAILGMVSEANRANEEKVLHEMTDLGGRVISLAESGADVEFHSDVPEDLRAVLYLPVLQLIALERSIAKGLNPDRPTHLSAVIKLDL